jgi:hypothetical protein
MIIIANIFKVFIVLPTLTICARGYGRVILPNQLHHTTHSTHTAHASHTTHATHAWVLLLLRDFCDHCLGGSQ